MNPTEKVEADARFEAASKREGTLLDNVSRLLATKESCRRVSLAALFGACVERPLAIPRKLSHLRACRYRRLNQTLQPSVRDCRQQGGGWHESVLAMAESDLALFLDGSGLVDVDRNELAKERATWKAHRESLPKAPMIPDQSKEKDDSSQVFGGDGGEKETDPAVLEGLFAAMDPFVRRRSPQRDAQPTPQRLNSAHARIQRAQREGAASLNSSRVKSIPSTPSHESSLYRSTPTRTPRPVIATTSTSLFGDSPKSSASRKVESPVNDAARLRLSKLRGMHCTPLATSSRMGTPQPFKATPQ